MSTGIHRQMKALVYTGPETLVYRETPDPESGEEALIQVAHVGICGSDMHAGRAMTSGARRL